MKESFGKRRNQAMAILYLLDEKESQRMKQLYRMALEQFHDKRFAMSIAQAMIAMTKLHPEDDPFAPDMQLELKARASKMLKDMSHLSDKQFEKAFEGWL